MLKSSTVALIVALPLVAAALPASAHAQQSSYLRELDLMKPELLAKVRQDCAEDQMPGILAKVQKDNPSESLPPADTYCLKALAVSASQGILLDLYINLALQEQGQSEYHAVEQAQLLSHDESGKTAGSILRAAKAGQTTYISIKGATRPLSCPLALDAGYTWAYQFPDKHLSYEPTAAEAAEIAHACYVPSTARVNVNGQPMAGQAAGLYAGASLGRLARQHPSKP